MLVLRRKVGEVIVVNGDIQIEVIEISRTRVKLGIRAPREVSVERREAVVLASENRCASDLLLLLGNNGLENLLTRLPGFSGDHPQVPFESADM